MSDVGHKPFDPALLDTLEALAIDRWKGTVWRVVVGDGAPLRRNIRGARWNPSDVEVLYTSLCAEGALAEVKHMLERQPVPIRAALTVHALEVQLSKVVDLSTETQLSRVGLDMNAVVADDVVVPQRIGGAVSVTGASGLLVPSARLAAVNLVIFVNNLAPGDFFDVK